MNSLFSFIGLFLFLAGFIVGLGAVTVIDLHGLLGIRSVYWTDATIRTHKVTKPLIWLGTFLTIIGGGLFYTHSRYSLIMIIHAVIALLLILNGCFLTFVISPYLLDKEKKEKGKITLLPFSLQWKIALSFIVSFTGWWGSLLLLVWYLLFVY